MSLRMDCKIWWGWRRHELSYAYARLKRRVLFRSWRWLGQLAYDVRERLVEHDAQHSHACSDLIEQTSRPPVAMCGACGLPIEDAQ
jgi:hypothetical protein